MGVTEGVWRLKAILFIFFMLTFLYGTQYYFVEAQDGVDVVDSDIGVSENLTEADMRQDAANVGSDIVSFFGGIYEGFTFQSIEGMPGWASFILTIFSSALIIVTVYVSYTFVYEVIKALPFT